MWITASISKTLNCAPCGEVAPFCALCGIAYTQYCQHKGIITKINFISNMYEGRILSCSKCVSTMCYFFPHLKIWNYYILCTRNWKCSITGGFICPRVLVTLSQFSFFSSIFIVILLNIVIVAWGDITYNLKSSKPPQLSERQMASMHITEDCQNEHHKVSHYYNRTVHVPGSNCSKGT